MDFIENVLKHTELFCDEIMGKGIKMYFYWKD
ncbi:hypothetical protein M2092_000328 [Fusobacterium sp. PH5-44]